MADVEAFKFQKTVEKLCIDCVVDVAKLIAECKNGIGSRMRKLRSDIVKVPFPSTSSNSDELEKLPKLINETLKREGSDFSKLILLEVKIEMNTKARKISDRGHELSGPLAG